VHAFVQSKWKQIVDRSSSDKFITPLLTPFLIGH
jgi:hypothetical protein